MTGIADIRESLDERENTARQMNHGRKCEPDGYLADVLEEVHRDCEHRTEGACRACGRHASDRTTPRARRSTADPPP